MVIDLIYRAPRIGESEEICVGDLSMLFSYATLVAVRIPGEMLQLESRSQTTARHINACGYRDARKASHYELESLALVGMAQEVRKRATQKLTA